MGKLLLRAILLVIVAMLAYAAFGPLPFVREPVPAGSCPYAYPDASPTLTRPKPEPPLARFSPRGLLAVAVAEHHSHRYDDRHEAVKAGTLF